MSPLTSNNGYVFPLYLNHSQKTGNSETHSLSLETERQANLNPKFMTVLAARIGETTPESIFHYLYGVLHAPAYRTRYAAFLRIDFLVSPCHLMPTPFTLLPPWGKS